MKKDKEIILNEQFNVMKKDYNNKPFPTYEERKEILLSLKKSILDNEQKIYQSLNKDYGYRSEFDTLISDIVPIVGMINYSLKNLKKWMRKSRRHSGLFLFPSKVEVHYQPLGVVGVITPWNFPIYLSLGPAIQAIAAGNRVLIKMSETTPETTKIMKKVLSTISKHIDVIDGWPGSGSVFSRLPFNHLIFTGSSYTGKSVAKAAADNLTPITLELGGKSPTIIADDICIESVVNSIMIGKITNGGQICVAPDYIFVPENKKDKFIKTFIKSYGEYYDTNLFNNNQTHVVSDKQFERLNNMIEDAKTKGASIHTVKNKDSNTRKLPPHLIEGVNEDMLIIQEEIFGTILPIITYKDINEVISYINSKPRPLALYIMSNNNKLIDKILKNTHSGGVSINDSAMHVMADDAPFGGIGNSGIGHYHGHEGFLTFSKAKTVLRSKSWIPKNKFILKNRDLLFKILRKVFLR